MSTDAAHRREMLVLMSALNMARNTCVSVLGLGVVPSTQPEYRELALTVQLVRDALIRGEVYLRENEAHHAD